MNAMMFQFTVGSFNCTVIKDAVADDIHMNMLLVQNGHQQVLIECGMGRSTPFPVTGKLLDRLSELKIEPDEIDMVILSHADFDHIGGALDKDKPTFPRACVVILQEELDFWSTSPKRFKADSADIEESFKQLSNLTPLRLEQLGDSVKAVPSDTEVVPGICIVAAAGHTPGHAIIQITSGAEQLWFIGDMLYTPEDIHDPEWYAVADFDPARAVATRKRLLPQLVREHIRVMGYHLPFPGIGYFSEYGQGWAWTADNREHEKQASLNIAKASQ